ncbi:unnamed protein product [Eruca vesicaria subsp. sativa]|uniref:H(+)-exporting diphosphatase n=1 Tax=Eruca vesicaria subsp. sativa TaxID=29727 RepID=A0ABC8LL90_ERUVS|nr:unnamed protein product [Eruca vesicaria subsp. sativa]
MHENNAGGNWPIRPRALNYYEDVVNAQAREHVTKLPAMVEETAKSRDGHCRISTNNQREQGRPFQANHPQPKDVHTKTNSSRSCTKIAISASNTGGAWDNAKKYIEPGVSEHSKSFGSKGSEPHKAAVIGETIGEPLKDTSGPSLNILIKLMVVESLIFAPFFATHGGILFKYYFCKHAPKNHLFLLALFAPSLLRLFRQTPHSYFSLSSSSRTTVSVSGRHHLRRLTAPTTTLRSICSHSPSDIVSEHPGIVRIYKDGRVERLSGTETVPASLAPQNGVVSKDVVYSPKHNLSVRLFLPHKARELTGAAGNKLPLLIYIHGGAWIVESPFSPIYHNFLTEAVKAANCLAVSVQYRRAPEHPIPAAYEDSWSAIQWIVSHSDRSGPVDWINEYADFNRVFMAGDSAGANMSHHMAMRAGEEKLNPRIKGVAIVHPAFWGTDPVDEHDVQDVETRRGIAEIWEKIASPNSVNGTDDPLFNVVGSDSDFSGLGCEKVLVAVAGKDVFVRQGLGYAAKLKRSGWKGDLEVMEEGDEDHCFHLLNPNSENAPKFMKKFVEFITS